MVDGKLKASSLGSIPYNGDLYWISYDIGIIASDSWQKQEDYLVQEDLDGAIYNGMDITAKGRYIFKKYYGRSTTNFSRTCVVYRPGS